MDDFGLVWEEIAQLITGVQSALFKGLNADQVVLEAVTAALKCVFVWLVVVSVPAFTATWFLSVSLPLPPARST